MVVLLYGWFVLFDLCHLGCLDCVVLLSLFASGLVGLAVVGLAVVVSFVDCLLSCFVVGSLWVGLINSVVAR